MSSGGEARIIEACTIGEGEKEIAMDMDVKEMAMDKTSVNDSVETFPISISRDFGGCAREPT